MPLRQPIVVVMGHVDHGKCVAPDTLVQLADGTFRTAKEIYDSYFDSEKATAIDNGVVVELKDGPEIFSFDGEKIVRKTVSHAWKRSAPKQMVSIALASGDSVTVTPEHPFYMANGTFRGWKPAAEIQETDFVLVPALAPQREQNISALKEKIIERLDKAGSFIVFIDEYEGKELLSRISDLNLEELKRNGFFSAKNPQDCARKKRFRLRDFLALCRLLGFSKSHAYDVIHSLKNASPKWRAGHTSNPILLPKTLEDFVKLAYAVGCIQGDGSLYKKRVALHNNDEDVQAAFCKALEEVFGVESKVIDGHTCKMVVTTGGLTLGRFLTEGFGLPSEDKSANITLPEVLCFNKQILAAFIRGWFDTDGYVSPFNNCVEITSKSGEIVRRVSAALLSFGILGSVYRKGIYWNIRVANKPYVRRFLELIGSNSGFKLGRLVEAARKGETSRIFDISPISGASVGKAKISNEVLPYASRYGEYAQLSRGTLLKMNAASKQQVCDAIFVEESVRFVKIRKKEIVEPPSEFVYDFTVPDTKNFVAERMVLHNTSLLDAIRSTNVAKKEAGAITQHIGASEVPLDSIKETCAGVLAARKMQFTIPGLLFIDTPGHESFTHLRERGGSIADIAVLVVDIAQGFQPQTVESIRILREFKTPFVVAANKVDLVTGWKSAPQENGCACSIISNIDKQKPEVQGRLDELLYGVVGKLHELGMESERFDRVSDFTKQIAILPVSAKTGEGLPELLLSIAGLSQKFLENELKTEAEGIGKGSILELREEKGLGTTIDVIIYDGVLRKNDEIIFGTMNGSAKTKVRGLLKPKLQPTGDGDKFEYVDEVHAAAGVKIYAPGLEGALSGSPLLVDDGNPATDQLKEIEEMIKHIMFESDKSGVIVKADTLGSLEALVKLLSSQGADIKRAGVGKVSKKDVVDASVVAASDPYKGAVLSFNIEVGEDAEMEAAKTGVKVFFSKVIYSLCDDYSAWVSEMKKNAAGSAVERLPFPGKILAMPGCTFRASKPAIFGVEILGGKLKKGVRLMNLRGDIVGEVREIQKDGKPVSEAKRGEQLAISVEGAICGKSFVENDVLLVYVGKKDAAELLASAGAEMTEEERGVLAEITAITDARLI